MLNLILTAILPALVTLGLGMLAGCRRDEDFRTATAFNRMVLVYALPLALFAGTIVIPRSVLFSDLPLLLTLLVGTAAPYLAALLGARYVFKRDLSSAALQALAFGFPAIAFTGLAILTPLIHDKATIVVDISGLTANIIILPITLILLSYGGTGEKDAAEGGAKSKPNIGSALKHALTQPVVLSPVVAVLMVLVGLKLPGVLTNSMKLLGGTVGGISLFASGVILQASKPGFSRPAALSTAARLLIIPGFMLLSLRLIGMNQDVVRNTVLALGLAAAPMQVILSTRYKVAEKENAAVLLYTNVLSAPTLALLIWLTG